MKEHKAMQGAYTKLGAQLERQLNSPRRAAIQSLLEHIDAEIVWWEEQDDEGPFETTRNQPQPVISEVKPS